MQEVILSSSNITLPTLGAAEGGAVGRETEIEAKAAAEASEQARAEINDRAQQDRAEPNAVRDEALGRTIDLLA